MRVCIATGIYPPEIGGPAFYAKNLSETLRTKGQEVDVVTFGLLKILPIGFRHLALFLRLLPVVARADVVIALDTFSAGMPALLAAMLFHKPFIVRTGGDFIWEQYTERTGELVILPDFYDTKRVFSIKEKIYFAATRFLVKRSFMVFSSNFQKQIWMRAYALDESRTRVIPNAIMGSFESIKPERKNFLFYGRDLKLRNKKKLMVAFQNAKKKLPEIVLEVGQLPQSELLEKIRRSYCIILPSISEVTPNYVLDALRCGKPFILTKYSEFAETYPDFGLFVDPLDANDITEKIIEMANDATYQRMVERIQSHPITRTYSDLTDDFLELIKTNV